MITDARKKTVTKPKPAKPTMQRLQDLDPKCVVVAQHGVEEEFELVAYLATTAEAKAFVMGFNTARGFETPVGLASLADQMLVKPAQQIADECVELRERYGH